MAVKLAAIASEVKTQPGVYWRNPAGEATNQNRPESRSAPREMRKLFSQVNVFSADPLGGNRLAVVYTAEGLSEAQMAALARWTNL